MPDDIRIRGATEADFPAVNRMISQLSKKPLPRLSEHFAAMLVAASEELGTHFLVLEVDGDVAGMLTMVGYTTMVYGRVARIEDILIDERYRRQGLGEKMLEYALNLARKSRAVRVEITGSPERQAARALYEGMGFTERAASVLVRDLG
ncbi:MAG: GNAT family N-acetyltransferase [Deinococcus sp.]|nr:GNAT family N-acetyltransferase [Deinococcus sp.]